MHATTAHYFLWNVQIKIQAPTQKRKLCMYECKMFGKICSIIIEALPFLRRVNISWKCTTERRNTCRVPKATINCLAEILNIFLQTFYVMDFHKLPNMWLNIFPVSLIKIHSAPSSGCRYQRMQARRYFELQVCITACSQSQLQIFIATPSFEFCYELTLTYEQLKTDWNTAMSYVI